MQTKKTNSAFLKRLLSCALVLCLLTLLMPCPTPHASAAGNDIYVGCPDKSPNYRTINEAVAACAANPPASEAERITVHIAPGTYREQVLIHTPYLSFVNAAPDKGEVKLTWYYGIGYKYYSVGDDGYYNAANAASHGGKLEPTSRWGCSVYIRTGATAFRAENIVFEASFNRYITQEELADGVEPSGSQSINFARYQGADVTSKAATERAAAIAIDATQTEFYRCTFLGSQDTMYTGGQNVGYFKDCRIEGNTDYIFGGGDFVFDNTELRFFGYSGEAAGGYITAARQQTKGYLFYGCTISGNGNNSVNTGYFGRPWRDTAAVTFLNTTLTQERLIHSAGWTSMSGVTPEQASFHEYGTVLPDGAPVNTGGRVRGTVMNAGEAAAITREQYFGDWTPYYYGGGNAQEMLKWELNADDLSIGDYTAPLSVNDGFCVMASEEAPITVDDSGAKAASDGSRSVTNRLKLGGAGSTDGRSIQVTAHGKGSLTVYMMSSNSSEARTALLLPAGYTTGERMEDVGGTNLDAYTFAIPTAGVYYLMSEASGINVYYAALYQVGEDEPMPAVGEILDNTRAYTIRNANSNLYLGVEGGVGAAGSNVNQQAMPAEPAAVLWELIPAERGYYYLSSCLGEPGTYLLDLDYGKTEDGTNIGIYTTTGADAQLFKLVANADGSYCIVTKPTTDQSCLGVSGSSTEDGANVLQWHCTGSDDQKWFMEAYSPVPAYTVADAVRLQRMLLCIDTLEDGYDLNDDGAVDGFDLCVLKQYLLENGAG